MHNYKKDSSQGQGRMRDFLQGGGDPTPLCLSVCLSACLSILIKKGRIYIEGALLFLCCWLYPALPLLSLIQYEISTFPSSFFSLVSPITLAHNERQCFPGSCRLTCRSSSHSSLSLPRHFWGEKKTRHPLSELFNNAITSRQRGFFATVLYN